MSERRQRRVWKVIGRFCVLPGTDEHATPHHQSSRGGHDSGVDSRNHRDRDTYRTCQLSSTEPLLLGASADRAEPHPASRP